MLSFTPGVVGSTLAIVSGARLLLVRVDDDAAAIDALWTAIGSGESLQSTLDVLTANGLSKAPAFALAEVTSDGAGGSTINCIVRGDVSLDIATTAGPRSVDAVRATTWVEETVGGVESFTASGGAAVGSPLPVAVGAVWASSLSWTVGDGSAPVAPVALVAPVAEVTPVTPVEPLAPEPPVAATVAEHTITAQTVTSAVIEDEIGASAYDKLFEEETVVRSIEDAAVRPETEDEHEPSAPSQGGDHDGMTVMTSDIAKLRAGRKTKQTEEPPPPPSPRYLLHLSTGSVEVLDGTALVGRAPSVSKVSGGTVPKLIAIPGNQDISRNHVQFSVEGDTVVVTDLNSRNGTSIVLPGKPPQLLRQGETSSVLAGTLVDLGGGITITVGQES